MLVLSGGTGTPKLLLGLKQLLGSSDLNVVVNTAEDCWISGNYVSPDIDTVLYTFSGLVDKTKWWGIEGDSFLTHDFLKVLGSTELMALGDKDRAVHIFRSELLRNGRSLSEATMALAKALDVKQRVVPMTDDPVATIITTSEKDMHFQEFWVSKRGEPDVLSVRIEGIKEAQPSPAFLELLHNEESVILGPSNPVTSIGAILALPGVREKLEGMRVIAISPLVGNKPVSGPAAKFMTAWGVPVNDDGVAALLGKLDAFVVSRDSSFLGKCVRMDTLMRTELDCYRLARNIIELCS
ncbi:MAG: 2-phospho-L-lactate transferase [Methanotrichaceae archaeon]|nr:2-phospho-L-lactate transferase [Methanotrichaceae archaeon]